MNCRLCEKRRPRRFCPASGGDICSPCCGQERENTLRCPLDCEYLIEARHHEHSVVDETAEWPNDDIELTSNYLQRIEHQLVMVGRILLEAVRNVPGAVDFDVREALASLTRTYRTLQSGLIYESLPNNPLAAAIHSGVQQRIQEMRQLLARNARSSSVRDADILGSLVFFQRFELRSNNGRRLGRAFLSKLMADMDEMESDRVGGKEPSGLIIP